MLRALGFTSSLGTSHGCVGGGRISPLHDRGGDVRDGPHSALLTPGEVGNGMTTRVPLWYHTPGKASPKVFFTITEGTKRV